MPRLPTAWLPRLPPATRWPRIACACCCLAALPPAPALAAQALPLPTVDTPTGGGGSVTLEPVAERARTTRRLVYSCVEGGRTTYADRPCGPLPTVRELNVASPPVTAIHAGSTRTPTDADATATRRAGSPAGRAGRGPAPDDRDGDAVEAAERKQQLAHEQRCTDLQEAMVTIDARMRAGYTAAQAGRLWDQWRAARARLAAANC